MKSDGVIITFHVTTSKYLLCLTFTLLHGGIFLCLVKIMVTIYSYLCLGEVTQLLASQFYGKKISRRAIPTNKPAEPNTLLSLKS
jgi:hypothetical protein